MIYLLDFCFSILDKFANLLRTLRNKQINLLLFTGIGLYPFALLFLYASTGVVRKAFGNTTPLTSTIHFNIWMIALIPSAFLLAINLRDLLIYKKRNFSRLDEWLWEKTYSRERAMEMFPPIQKKLLFDQIKGLCIGKTAGLIKSKYVCIDPTDSSIANHLAIIGNSSAGKSSGPILTTLIANFMYCNEHTPPPVSYLVVDPKPELCRLSSCGDKWTRMLDPSAERGTSYGWDPYFGLSKHDPPDVITDRINVIVSVIVEDSNEDNAFFQDSARNMLSGALIYEFMVNGSTFIRSLRTILSEDLNSYIRRIKSDSRCPSQSKMLLSEFGKADDHSNATEDIKKSLKQRTAVFTRSDTEWFLDPESNYLMCDPTVLDEHISMFLSIKRADLETYAVLFRIIITQCSDYLSRRDDYDKEKPPVVIIIDEFTNIGGKIPKFCENLGFIRSKKVTFVTIFQQYSQLQKLYGNEEARTILNMGHQLVLSCEDTELGKIFSDKGGEFKEKNYSLHTHGIAGPPGDSNVSWSPVKRIRMMDDLTSLNTRFESIAFINGSEYIRFSKCRYYLEPDLKARSEECVQYHASMARKYQ